MKLENQHYGIRASKTTVIQFESLHFDIGQLCLTIYVIWLYVYGYSTALTHEWFLFVHYISMSTGQCRLLTDHTLRTLYVYIIEG